MIIGSYKLLLTCDGCGRAGVYESESPDRARANARFQGWKVQLSKEMCYCPLCATGGRASIGPKS